MLMSRENKILLTVSLVWISLTMIICFSPILEILQSNIHFLTKTFAISSIVVAVSEAVLEFLYFLHKSIRGKNVKHKSK